MKLSNINFRLISEKSKQMLKEGKARERRKVVGLLSRYQLINLSQHFRSKMHFVNRNTGKSNSLITADLNTFEMESKKLYFLKQKNQNY